MEHNQQPKRGTSREQESTQKRYDQLAELAALFPAALQDNTLASASMTPALGRPAEERDVDALMQELRLRVQSVGHHCESLTRENDYLRGILKQRDGDKDE